MWTKNVVLQRNLHFDSHSVFIFYKRSVWQLSSSCRERRYLSFTMKHGWYFHGDLQILSSVISEESFHPNKAQKRNLVFDCPCQKWPVKHIGILWRFEPFLFNLRFFEAVVLCTENTRVGRSILGTWRSALFESTPSTVRSARRLVLPRTSKPGPASTAAPARVLSASGTSNIREHPLFPTTTETHTFPKIIETSGKRFRLFQFCILPHLNCKILKEFFSPVDDSGRTLAFVRSAWKPDPQKGQCNPFRLCGERFLCRYLDTGWIGSPSKIRGLASVCVQVQNCHSYDLSSVKDWSLLIWGRRNVSSLHVSHHKSSGSPFRAPGPSSAAFICRLQTWASGSSIIYRHLPVFLVLCTCHLGSADEPCGEEHLHLFTHKHWSILGCFAKGVCVVFPAWIGSTRAERRYRYTHWGFNMQKLAMFSLRQKQARKGVCRHTHWNVAWAFRSFHL